MIRRLVIVFVIWFAASSAYALDSPAKRRAAAHFGGAWNGPGVTPDATPAGEWRSTAAGNYFFAFNAGPAAERILLILQ